MKHETSYLPTLAIGTLLSGCEYFRLLRPSVLKQLNPQLVRLVNTLAARRGPPERGDRRPAIRARRTSAGPRAHDGVFREVIVATPNGHLVALNATDGRPVWQQVFADVRAGESATMAPLVVKNLLIVAAQARSTGC